MFVYLKKKVCVFEDLDKNMKFKYYMLNIFLKVKLKKKYFFGFYIIVI